ncbi:MAG: beta-ketoacyl-ACP synthase II [Phycisphaerales bacterium]|nr:beta-ketoacyl-ACP synthase II [Phycisphaerales bacterium]
MMHNRRVVVTGMGALTSIGNTVSEYWDALIAGKSGATRITLFDPSRFKTNFACEVKGFDPLNFIDKADIKKMDRFSHFALATAHEAITQSKIQVDQLKSDRVGVILGSGIGGLPSFQNSIMDYARGDGTPRLSPYFIPRMISDIAAGFVSIKYNFRGPNFGVTSACASSNHAISVASQYIRAGIVDVMLTGGSESVICETGIAGFNSLKALSERNDDPLTASRPYDRDRDGFVMGEGSGTLILEDLEHALKRGAPIFCELAGVGATADAYHITAPHPDGLAVKDVMLQALANAQCKPEDVDYINTHGTSTPLGDIAEVKAIQYVFGEQAYKVNINSTKSMIGHCLGAAGAVEAIATICTILHGVVHPTINHFNDDPEIDSKLNFTFNKAQHRKVDVALSNTFGFGGHNACVVFKRFVH